MTALDIESLPASVHSDGFGVLGVEEIETIKATTDAHFRFNSDIRKCEINQNFRLICWVF